MKKNKTLLITLFFFITYVINSQSRIEAGKYEDLKTSPEIAIAGGGTLMDWANLHLYHGRNQMLMKVSEPNRVVFIGNSITENWSLFDEGKKWENPLYWEGEKSKRSTQAVLS